MEKSISKNSKNLKSEEFKCSHCSKVFKTETGLIKHTCKLKKRWLEKDESYFIKAFAIFQKFYDMMFKSKKSKTRDDFIASKFYDYFIRLSKFISNGLVAFTEKYYVYLFKNNVNMNLWDNHTIYETFILKYNKMEEPSYAIERSLLNIEKWSENTQIPWTNFFREVSIGLAIDWIRFGKISPWLIWCNNADFSQPLLSRMSDEQLNMIGNIINPNLWQNKVLYDEHKIMDYNKMLIDQGM